VNKVDGKLQELCVLIRRQQQPIEAILTSAEAKYPLGIGKTYRNFQFRASLRCRYNGPEQPANGFGVASKP
jgi:hypothetical protein